MRLIRILYQGNSCDISMGPVAFFGFSITRGIRQGCPLSPLLFAVASELILRRLSRSVRDNTARAWADDIAMVIPRGLEVLPCIASIFLEFGLISGLLLSIGKTVIAPLFPIDLVEFRSLLTAAAPSWGAMQVSFAAKYLGVFLLGLTREPAHGRHLFASISIGRNNGANWVWGYICRFGRTLPIFCQS